MAYYTNAYTLMPAFFFKSSKHFWKAMLGIANSFCIDFSFISSIIAKLYNFIGVFSFGKSKTSAGAKSGEYGGWGMITTENPRTSIVIMVQNPWMVSAQFSAFLMNCYAQSAHKVIILIDRMTLWQARIHNALRHFNWRKQWAKLSHLTDLDVLFSVLSLLDDLVSLS